MPSQRPPRRRPGRPARLRDGFGPDVPLVRGAHVGYYVAAGSPLPHRGGRWVVVRGVEQISAAALDRLDAEAARTSMQPLRRVLSLVVPPLTHRRP